VGSCFSKGGGQAVARWRSSGCKVAVKRLQGAAGNCNEFFKAVYLCLHTGSEQDSESKDQEDTTQCPYRAKKPYSYS